MNSRVLLCTGSLDGGGSERQLWQLAKGIDPLRFQPLLYLLYRRGVYLDSLPETVPVIDYWGQHQTKLRLPGTIHRSQVEHLAQVILEQEINLVYDRTFHMTLITASACRKAGVPRVSVIVSPPSRDFVQSRERFAFLKKRLLARAYAANDGRTIAVSQDVAEDAAAFYGLDLKSIAVLPSPVDIEGIKAAASRHVSLAETQIHFCVVGRLSGEKGQRSAVLAFQKYLQRTGQASSRLHIVGDGPDRQKLEDLVAELELRQQVLFHGFLANPYPFISKADMLLIPSHYEGMPNVALEAMVLRTPIVATRCSKSLSRLLQGDSSGGQALGELVHVGDAEAMAKSMVAFASQRETWQTRVAAAERYVSTKHTLPSWLQRVESLFSEVIATHRIRGRQSPNASCNQGIGQ